MAHKLSLGSALADSSKRIRKEPSKPQSSAKLTLGSLPDSLGQMIFRFCDSKSGAHFAYVFTKLTQPHGDSMKVMKSVLFKLKLGHDLSRNVPEYTLDEVRDGDSQRRKDRIEKANAQVSLQRSQVLHDIAPSAHFLKPFSDLSCAELAILQKATNLKRLDLSTCQSLPYAEIVAFAKSHPNTAVCMPYIPAVAFFMETFDHCLGKNEEAEFQKNRKEMQGFLSLWKMQATYQSEQHSFKGKLENFLNVMADPSIDGSLKKAVFLQVMHHFHRDRDVEAAIADFNAIVQELEKTSPSLENASKAFQLYFTKQAIQEERRSNLKVLRAKLEENPKVKEGSIHEIYPQVELDLCFIFRTDIDCKYRLKEAQGEKVDEERIDKLLMKYVHMTRYGEVKFDCEPYLTQKALDYLLQLAR